MVVSIGWWSKPLSITQGQPFINGCCFNWMIGKPLLIGNGWLEITKHPFKTGCLGFQVMVNCWFGYLWFPSERDCYFRVSTRKKNPTERLEHSPPEIPRKIPKLKHKRWFRRFQHCGGIFSALPAHVGTWNPKQVPLGFDLEQTVFWGFQVNWLVVSTPSKKYARQNGFIFPKVRGEKVKINKYLSCHHLVNIFWSGFGDCWLRFP